MVHNGFRVSVKTLCENTTRQLCNKKRNSLEIGVRAVFENGGHHNVERSILIGHERVQGFTVNMIQEMGVGFPELGYRGQPVDK